MVDASLSLMSRPKDIGLESITQPDEQEGLFILKSQVKHEVISALVNSTSQRSLIPK